MKIHKPADTLSVVVALLLLAPNLALNTYTTKKLIRAEKDCRRICEGYVTCQHVKAISTKSYFASDIIQKKHDCSKERKRKVNNIVVLKKLKQK